MIALTCPKMTRIITAIATKHGVSLTEAKYGEVYIKLTQKGYQPLVIEKPWPNQIAVAHTFIQEGDVMYDPEIVFHLHKIPTGGLHDHSWLPIQITMSPVNYYREMARLNDKFELIHIDKFWMTDVAKFAEEWADNIESQNWLENGVKAS